MITFTYCPRCDEKIYLAKFDDTSIVDSKYAGVCDRQREGSICDGPKVIVKIKDPMVSV